jgi:hypothetical protein
VFVEALGVPLLVRNSPQFVELRFHYRVHKSSPPVAILRQNNSVYAPHHRFLKIQFNFTVYSHLRQVFQVASFTQVSPLKILYAPLPSPIRATCSVHLIILGLFARIVFGEQ